MLLKDLKIDQSKLDGLCLRFGVKTLEAFGSFTRGDAGAGSDLDILVTFESGRTVGLEFVELQQELEMLVGRPVDLLTRTSVERSPNKYFRRFALSQTEPLFLRES